MSGLVEPKFKQTALATLDISVISSGSLGIIGDPPIKLMASATCCEVIVFAILKTIGFFVLTFLIKLLFILPTSLF